MDADKQMRAGLLVASQHAGTAIDAAQWHS
jgi:hypothetical protein